MIYKLFQLSSSLLLKLIYTKRFIESKQPFIYEESLSHLLTFTDKFFLFLMFYRGIKIFTTVKKLSFTKFRNDNLYHFVPVFTLIKEIFFNAIYWVIISILIKFIFTIRSGLCCSNGKNSM